MAQPAELVPILERRQALLDESARLRHQVFGELSELQRAYSWVDTGYSLFFSLRSWWPVAAGALGLFIGSKRGGFLRKLGKVWSLWRVAKQGLQLWGQYSSSMPE